MTSDTRIDQLHTVTRVKGRALLSNPLLNKETAFTHEEREELGLLGLLPAQVESIETQVERAYGAYNIKDSNLERHIYLRSLQDRNEVLFYRLLQEHISEMMPIIYTPVVGEACQQFSHIYRQHRGLFISYPDRDRIGEILANTDKQVKVIVVTDGQRILGLGDQGAGGMGIPIGKLSLYTLCGGIDPFTTLPVLLDVGTNNESKLHDPLYMGWKNERIDEESYYDFLEQFVEAVIRRWPDVLLQWEDFANPHARPILEKYGDRLCTFNDDIQGTAAVALSGLLAAMKSTASDLKDQRIVMFGAGSAGMGIADLIVSEMMAQGLSESDATSRIFLIDRPGLLHSSMTKVQAAQKRFLKNWDKLKSDWSPSGDRISLEDTIKHSGATVLIGTSAQPGSFTEKIVAEMTHHTERPVVFPLSNPTSRCEALPEDILRWSKGRAMVATGSPFPPVRVGGQSYTIGQCNNCYIFPGMGLAVVASGMSRVTESMFLKAAHALSDDAPAILNPNGSLFPPLDRIRDVSEEIAVAVAKEAIRLGLVEDLKPEEVEARVHASMWEPSYRRIRYLT